jgi:hypothetical protein
LGHYCIFLLAFDCTQSFIVSTFVRFCSLK